MLRPGRVSGNPAAMAGASDPFGPELVTNGDFASSVGWTLSGGCSIGSGVLSCNGSGTGKALRAAADTVTAGNYAYSFDVLTTDGGDTVTVNVGSAGGGTSVPGSNAPGSFSGTVVSTAANQNLFISPRTSVGTYDNFSIKKIN